MNQRIFAGALLLGLFASAAVHAAPFPSLSMDVGVCDPNAPQNCVKPDSSGNVPVTGSITATLGGFTPSASGARMTPLSVTTSDSSGSLPTGAVTVVSNVGTTNPMYCNVNGVAATTSDQLIGPNSWFAFTIPGGVTTLHCTATGGTTIANGVGGSGLPTGAGGGSSSGGGGGGAVFGPTAVGSAAANPPVLQGGTIDGTATGNVAVQKIVSGVASSNTAQVNGVTTLAGSGAVGTGAQRVAVGTDTATIAGSAPGTAGTPSTNVVSVQGVASGTTLPVTANQGGTWNITNVSGTVSLPTGAATSANQATEISSLATIATNTGNISQPIPACGAAPCVTTIGNVGSDPSSGVGTPTMAFLALPATATTQIVALSGTKVTYVTSRLALAGGTVNVTFKYGTGTNCGTGTTTLDGPWPLTAQVGFTEGNGVGAVMVVPAGQALCVTTDASVSGGVKLTYQQK